jgi:23S rRNA (adenine2503-C2)-methyltransferase
MATTPGIPGDERPRSVTPHLRGLTPTALAGCWSDLPIDPRLARRVTTRLVADYGDTLDGVPGLSKRLATELARRARWPRSRIVDRRASLADPFVKYLFEAQDGVRYEAVRIPLERPRWSICVSSQAGCSVGCRFCATGRLGLERNLEAWEMVDQVLAIRAESPERPVTGVVFQGQGEPLLNYENVIAAIAVLRDPCGGRIGADRITLSTVGIPRLIDRYTDERHPYRLILSLTSTRDDRRGEVIPAARGASVRDLAEAMRRHALARGAPVHIAWVLIRGFNTGPEEAEGLRHLFPDVAVRVSLIDVNDATGRHAPPADEERARFQGALAAHGLAFIRRYSGGSDIGAACGTLASTCQGGRVLLPAAEAHEAEMR